MDKTTKPLIPIKIGDIFIIPTVEEILIAYEISQKKEESNEL